VAVKKIGRGGFGTTYLAVDMGQKNCYCVVKQLELATANPESHRTALDLFAREAKTLAKLDHPQIPKLLDYFEENEQFYLIQNFVLGKDLEKEIKKGGIYQESSAKEFLRNILPVLKYIHDQKVIHRDIKPGNILREKETDKLFLIDFGAVKEQANTQLMNQNPLSAFTKISVGTMGFAPPEQLAMRPVYSSDIYALAATCLFLLTGKAPKDLCDDRTGELAWEKQTNVSATFARVLNKMLELDVRKRFASADEVIKALELVPYEQELAENMVNLSMGKDSTDEDKDIKIVDPTSQNLADAIRKRKEKLSANTSSSKNLPNTVPPSQPKLELTREIVIQSYRQGDRNFSQQMLNELDLQGLKLSGASFSQSKLIGTNLQKANLYRTNFYNANLAQANLKEANLRRAELYKANLKNADLQGADLTNANLNNAILKEANLIGANLKGAKIDDEQLKTAKVNWRTIFPNGKRRWL
jgi:serine/threonine-protein kinase